MVKMSKASSRSSVDASTTGKSDGASSPEARPQKGPHDPREQPKRGRGLGKIEEVPETPHHDGQDGGSREEQPTAVRGISKATHRQITETNTRWEAVTESDGMHLSNNIPSSNSARNGVADTNSHSKKSKCPPSESQHLADAGIGTTNAVRLSQAPRSTDWRDVEEDPHEPQKAGRPAPLHSLAGSGGEGVQRRGGGKEGGTETGAQSSREPRAGPPRQAAAGARGSATSWVPEPQARQSLAAANNAGLPVTATSNGASINGNIVNNNSGSSAKTAGNGGSGGGVESGVNNSGGLTRNSNSFSSQRSNNSSNNSNSHQDPYTLPAEVWRHKEEVPQWRSHGMSSSVPQDKGANPPAPEPGGDGGQRESRARDGMSSRDDAESFDDNLDDDVLSAGRKFTKKSSKNNFGSSTTLSSATETSDGDSDGHFHVVLRVRPLSTQEKQRKDQFVVKFPGDGLCAINNNGSERSFQFNVVFEPDAIQEDVFENCGIKRLVDNAVAGYTCTAFAFGQTGSGKTHTMTGPPAQYHQPGVTPDPKMYGIIQRSFKYLYQQIKQQGGGKVIRASYLEIYNEQVIDLLNNSHRRYLSVRWSKNKGFYVENLFMVECETLDDLMAVLEEGLRNRQTGSHGLNEFSSRSHSVLTVTIDSETQPEPEDESLYVTKRGKLSFVDLAGSEKVKDASGSGGGPGMLESNSINKSLLVLGNCISHLGDAKRRHGHIPYRDSKLTKLLSDSLGGNGITLMIACITPSSVNTTETMNTLRYASRAKKIKSKPTVKMDPREKLIVNLKREIKILRNENHYLRQQLDFPAKPKGQLQKENDEKFMKFMKEQKEKETGLYEMLQEYMVENENLRAENSEMHSTRDRIRREQQLLYRENEKLVKRVEDMERVLSQNPAMLANYTGSRQRTDGYGQYDLTSPRQSPVAPPAYLQLGSTHAGGRGTGGGNPPPGPMRPPHRLPEPVMRPAQWPADRAENGVGYASLNGHTSPRGGPRQMSPTRSLERKGSQASTTDAILSMNEQLKLEVMQLEGQIRQHQHPRDAVPPRVNGNK